MTATDLIEYSRLKVQRSIDSAKLQVDRNRLGQFATPTVLAMEMLDYAKSLLPPSLKIRFIDPAFGTGSFYSALLRTFPKSRIVESAGYEIDSTYGSAANQLWQGTSIRLHVVDFTRVKPPEIDANRFNLLICNPPYVRHQHLTSEEKLRLTKLVEETIGLRLNGLAGFYCYYLCLSHRWMAHGGLAGWLIPSEFMDVNYGKELKQYLLNHVMLLRIHRFDPNDIQFEDAFVSSAMVWFRKERPPPEHTVEFTYGGTLLKPAVSRYIPTNVLRNTAKWTNFPLTSWSEVVGQAQTRLRDLFEIKRGLATGANDFFVLTPEEAARHDLPSEFLKPVIPPPRYLTVDEIYADNLGGPIVNHKFLVLSCSLPEAIVKKNYPSVWRYLQTGIEAGIDKRYICQHRSPWYSQENRPPAPFLCPIIGRQSSKRARPFRFILNHSCGTATNVYSMLYPKPAMKKTLEDDNRAVRTIWETLNSIPSSILLKEGRVYGGGMYKLEPGELGKVPADSVMVAIQSKCSTKS